MNRQEASGARGLEHLAKRGIAEVAYGDKRRVGSRWRWRRAARAALLDEAASPGWREEARHGEAADRRIPREVTW